MEPREILESLGLEPAPSLLLPDEFWCRPILKHIRTAARAAKVIPDFVLGATMARVAMLIPPTIQPPILRGTSASFNWYACLIGQPSASKSASIITARKLLPTLREDIADGVPVGTGEGLAAAFLGEVSLPYVDESGKKQNRKVWQQVNKSVLVTVDEGEALMKIGERTGSTIFSTMRTGWTGGALGQTNAKVETRRLVQEGNYRLTVVIGFQPAHAAKLLADDVSGTPQRMHWFHEFDPGAPAPHELPPWPGVLPWKVPDTVDRELGIDAAIRAAFDERTMNELRGKVPRNLMDAHQGYSQVKLSSILAVMEGRMDVTRDDWELAAIALGTSNAVRNYVLSLSRQEAQRKAREGDQRAASRALTVNESLELRARVSMARAIANRAHKLGRTINRQDANRAVSSEHKRLVPLDEAINHALGMHWLAEDGDGWKPDRAVT